MEQELKSPKTVIKSDNLGLRKIIATAIKSNPYDRWNIVHEHENLVIVHYDDDKNTSVKVDMKKVGHIRGIPVDKEARCCVGGSFGYTPTATIDKLELNSKGKLEIKDDEGVMHVFDPEKDIFKMFFEGVVIRVIWHKSKMICMTHRRFNPERSRWGNSPSFMSMYREAGGPSAEQLFDTTKEYSNTCYMFLVVHPSLLVASKIKADKPLLTHIASFHMDVPYESCARGIKKFETTSDLDEAIQKQMIHSPKAYNLNEANTLLAHGLDGSGEAMIFYKKNAEGRVEDVLKVQGSEYAKRWTLRGNDPNPKHQFYTMLRMANVHSQHDWIEFKKLMTVYVPRVPANKDDLDFEIDSKADWKTYKREQLIQIIWMNFLKTLNGFFIEKALTYYPAILNEIEGAIEWVKDLQTQTSNNFDLLRALPRQVFEVISGARTIATERIKKGGNYKNGRHISKAELIGNIVEDLMRKLEGSKLYSIVKCQNRIANMDARAKLSSSSSDDE